MPPWLAEGLEVTCQIEDLAVGLGMTTFISPVRSVDGQHEVRCRAAGMWAEGVLHWKNSKQSCLLAGRSYAGTGFLALAQGWDSCTGNELCSTGLLSLKI